MFDRYLSVVRAHVTLAMKNTMKQFQTSLPDIQDIPSRVHVCTLSGYSRLGDVCYVRNTCESAIYLLREDIKVYTVCRLEIKTKNDLQTRKRMHT